MAESSLFIAASRVIWAFDVSKFTDPITGEETDPSDDFEDGYHAG